MSERESSGGTIWEHRKEWVNGKAVQVARLGTPVGIWAVVAYIWFELSAKLDAIAAQLHVIQQHLVK